MNKALYIIGIVLSVVFLIVCAFYSELVHRAEIESWLYQYNTSLRISDRANDLTFQAGLISLFFLLFFFAADLLGVLKVKTMTMKVMGIIGMCVTGIFVLWDLVMLSSPSHIGFDEVGPAFGLFSLATLAFSIVGLVQSIRFSNPARYTTVRVNTDLLDS